MSFFERVVALFLSLSLRRPSPTLLPLLVLSLNLLLSNDLFLSRHPKETTGLVDHGLLTLNEGN